MSSPTQISIAGLLTATTVAAIAAASFRAFPPLAAICVAFGAGLLTSYAWPGVVGGLALIVVVVLRYDDPSYREVEIELAVLFGVGIGFLPVLLAALLGKWVRAGWAEWRANS